MEFNLSFFSSGRKSGAGPRFLLSAASLLLSNLFTIGLAIYEHWTLAEVMWIYWGQSLIIGFFNFARILRLKDFSTKGFLINDRPVDPTPQTKRQTAWFFLFHYGFFHAVYFAFLLGDHLDIAEIGITGILIAGAVFFVNHLFSFFHNLDNDLARQPNIGSIMFFPYARIIPMHITIILGGMFGGDSVFTLIFFLGLKTGADLIMHAVEHAEARTK